MLRLLTGLQLKKTILVLKAELVHQLQRVLQSQLLAAGNRFLVLQLEVLRNLLSVRLGRLGRL